MLEAFFDELQKIGAIRFAKQAMGPGAAASTGAQQLKKLLPWLGAAGVGVGGTLAAQDIAKTYRIGRQVRKSNPSL